MRTLINKWQFGTKYVAILGLLIIFTVISCARKVTFLTSPIVPAARGYVKVKKDSNKNYLIKVELTDLAEVSRLQPSRNTYVVWMETDDQITRNIGQIKSSSSLFSSKLKASFETVSSSKPTKIFISAEDEADSKYPGMQVVLSTDKF
jgi:hypothetical protein